MTEILLPIIFACVGALCGPADVSIGITDTVPVTVGTPITATQGIVTDPPGWLVTATVSLPSRPETCGEWGCHPGWIEGTIVTHDKWVTTEDGCWTHGCGTDTTVTHWRFTVWVCYGTNLQCEPEEFTAQLADI